MSSHLNSGAMTRSNSAHSPPPNLNIPIPYHVIDTIITTYEQLLRERLLFSNEALGAEYRMIFKTQAYVYRRSTLTADTSTKLRLLYERITGRPARFCRFPNDEECYRKLTILIDKNNRIMPVEPLKWFIKKYIFTNFAIAAIEIFKTAEIKLLSKYDPAATPKPLTYYDHDQSESENLDDDVDMHMDEQTPEPTSTYVTKNTGCQTNVSSSDFSGTSANLGESSSSNLSAIDPTPPSINSAPIAMLSISTPQPINTRKSPVNSTPPPVSITSKPPPKLNLPGISSVLKSRGNSPSELQSDSQNSCSSEVEIDPDYDVSYVGTSRGSSLNGTPFSRRMLIKDCEVEETLSSSRTIMKGCDIDSRTRKRDTSEQARLQPKKPRK